ncbi:zinc finger BED domain-containing protein DAYSLEEPER-like [Primulina tabacum]|uniref:zinc finger BED domain-containing protein DAYSLEEPER-like n=1 Tax=Primulina tabacum TaxID=48773 RepID=UPI003F5970F7
MANRMFQKFDKYWKDYNILLSLDVIVDLRFKMQFVEFCSKKLYGHGSNELSFVKSKLVSLFEEYMGLASKSSSSNTSKSSHSGIDDNAFLPLNIGIGYFYLDELKIDRYSKCDVLAFWKAYQFKYPELAQMA